MDFHTKKIQEELISRLIQYAKIDTQSAYDIPKTPSTEKQKDLGKLLVEQLSEMDLSVEMDRYGYVYAHLPSNRKKGSKKIPPLGFIAHLDTTPDAPGGKIHPVIHRNYRKGDLKLKGGIIPAKDLEGHIGDTIITSDGTTLLGADDKAGIATIVTGIGQIINSNIKHGNIYLLFNTDEEIAAQLKKLNLKKFPVKSAYTFDSEGGNRIEDETFYAAKAIITIKGYNCHPGIEGFQTLKNAVDIAAQFISNIPITQRPATTKDRFGFYHIESLCGDPNKATLVYLIRDFDSDELRKKGDFLRRLGKTFNVAYGLKTITMRIMSQYPNMKKELDKHPEVVQTAFKAAESAGVKAQHGYIRGGTDGATLTVSHKIPCPNIFCGSYNVHSVNEFASVRDMVAAAKTLCYIVEKHKKYHSNKTR